MSDKPETDPWQRFRTLTRARIGLGRSGDALPTTALLDFQLAHARARDAVHGAADFDQIAAALAPFPTIRVHSAAPDRATYLRRPDLGRRLDDNSRTGSPGTAGSITPVRTSQSSNSGAGRRPSTRLRYSAS